MTHPFPTRWRSSLRFAASLFFVAAGANHFVHPAPYLAIIPPHFPSPTSLVVLSGIAEIAGGLGLLIPSLRRAAAWGLIALLVAVFPANVYMALAPHRIPAWHLPQWLLWARLPLQLVFIVWVRAAALKEQRVTPGD